MAEVLGSYSGDSADGDYLGFGAV